MEQEKKINIIYGQSGGPTSVINSSAYGLIKEAKKHQDKIDKIYAMHFGIEGLLNEDIIDLTSLQDDELKKLLTTPGAAFGSNRYKLNDEISDKEKYDKIISIFDKYNIHYFFYNGGNDSMETILKISNYAKKIGYKLNSIGIPKTIDNDLCEMDHSPGYPSAIRYIANSVSQIYYDDKSYLSGRVNIVEIMGRNAGWLTAGTKLAELNGAKIDLVYVPEVPFSLEDFLNKVIEIYNAKKHCLVCISEGIRNKNGKLIGTIKEEEDAFGHTQLGGVSVYLAHLITEKLKIKTRYFELSLLQRSNSIIPSSVDIKEAIMVGKKALLEALKGKTGKLIAIKRISNSPYKVKYVTLDISKVANKERTLPLKYINKEGNNITDEFLEYATPLIKDKKGNGLFEVFRVD